MKSRWQRLDRASLRNVAAPALLAGFFLFFVVLQCVWLAVDQRAVVEERDLLRVMHWGHVLRGTELGKALPATAQFVRHGPLLTLWSSPWMAIFGCSSDAAVMSLLPLAALLVVCTYFLARRFLSPLASAVAGVMVLTFHHFAVVEPLYPAYVFLKEYKADLPLSAMVAASGLSLLRLMEKPARRRILLFGVVAAAATLTRLSYPLYLLLWCFGLWVYGYRRPAQWLPALWGGVLALCIAAPWLLLNAGGIVAYFRERELSPEWALHTGMPTLFSVSNLSFYAVGLLRMLSPPLLGCVVLACFVSFFGRRRERALWLPVLLLGYVLLTLHWGKSVRFLTPLFALLALGAAGAVEMLHGAWRGVVSTALVVLCAMRVLAMQGVFGSYRDASGIDSAELRASRDDWSVQQMFADASAARREPCVLRIAVAPFLGHFRHSAFMQVAAREGVRLREDSGWRLRGGDWHRELQEAEFLVTKSGANGPALYAPHTEAINQWIATRPPDALRLVEEYLLPDGSRARLYQQRPAQPVSWQWGTKPICSDPVARFADGLALCDVDWQFNGTNIVVQCDWRADEAPARDYRLFLQVRDGIHVIAARSYDPARGAHPLATWQAGDGLIETYTIPIADPDELPSEWSLWIGWFRGLRRLPVAETDLPVLLNGVRIRGEQPTLSH